MGLLHRLLERPLVYRLWQAPFAAQKLRPIKDLPALRQAGRVLDMACGPGNHAQLFDPASYVGVDTNPDYIKSAQRAHGGHFEVGDACTYEPRDGERFDLIFANSFLHHLDDGQAQQALANLARLCKPGGRLLLMDLVMPERAGIVRMLARADRGDHARPYKHWQSLLESHFTAKRCEPYRLGIGPLHLWHMIYFEGTPRS
ncbi:MAG: SAM-dependent methyltransferase [Planctomycetota bacterium]|jgi:SAM-dependent methyltransferase